LITHGSIHYDLPGQEKIFSCSFLLHDGYGKDCLAFANSYSTTDGLPNGSRYPAEALWAGKWRSSSEQPEQLYHHCMKAESSFLYKQEYRKTDVAIASFRYCSLFSSLRKFPLSFAINKV
jgi:hypothetical protein